MRPTKTKQSELLHPLNRILGTEASVRVLRVLALAPTPLAAGEVARRAELGRTSIYPTLRDLEATEVIELVGVGAQRHVQLRQRHPLVKQLRELFRAEGARYEELVNELRRLVAEAPARPLSAWIEEPRPERPQQQEVTLRFIARPADLPSISDHLGQRIAKLERTFDLPIVLAGQTRSEAEAQHAADPGSLANIVLLDGVPPAALFARAADKPSTRGTRSHDALDQRARRLALAMALKFERDPGLVAQAATQVKKRLRGASTGERRELEEWARILDAHSATRLRRVLTEDSERATRLRQTLPLAQLLTPTEREAVIRSRTDAEVAAAVAGR